MCVRLRDRPLPPFPVRVPGLDPEKHLGKPLAEMEPYLKQVTHTLSVLALPSSATFIRHRPRITR